MNLAVVPTPAFDVDAPLDVPMMPPRSWFEEVPDTFDPRDGLIQIQLDGPEEGRFVALVAPEGEQILGPRDWQPPQSPTNYEFAHVGTTVTAEGDKIRTGNIGGNIDHAPPSYGMRAAIDLYANTASKVLRGRYHDVPGIGIVFTGAMWPGLTKRDALTAMSMAISADWRHVDSLRSHDLAGSQLVNAPALRPLPHGHQRHASYRPARFLPVAASLSGDVMFGGWVTDDNSAEFAGRLRRLEQITATIIATSVKDDLLDDDDNDVFLSVFGCKLCGGHGCAHCNNGVAKWTADDDYGFDMADEFPDEFPDDEDDL